jgi:hypothetical protein
MELRPFSLKHKEIFESYLQHEPHELSGYCFVNAFIWRCLYDIRWSEESGKLCLFYRDKAGCFMPLPPLGGLDKAAICECFDVMDSGNRNPELSRIENIEQKDASFFKECGFSIYEKSCDYLVSRSAIASLRGERLKHRRNLYNYFIKHNKPVFCDYRPRDRGQVEALFERWKNGRLAAHEDNFYSGMLEDSELAFDELLNAGFLLGVAAKVAAIGKEVVAFTSGAAINKDMFCVNFEIVDHRYKGLAQYIFTELAKTLDVQEINMMDDSGIESLKKTKMLFGNVRRVPSFTAVRKRQ